VRKTKRSPNRQSAKPSDTKRAKTATIASDASPEEGYAKGRLTRRHIVQNASRQFALHGFRGTTFDQVAAASGLAKGAVSGHFKRKRDLYLAVLKHSLAFFFELEESGAGLPPEEGLLMYLQSLGSHLSADSNARALLIQLIREADEEIRTEIIHTVLTKPFFQIRRHIEGVNPRIDSAAYSFFIFSSLLLDADQHYFYKLMAPEAARQHDMQATIRRLVAVIKSVKER
jgi:AcrR family transcriptional regulator